MKYVDGYVLVVPETKLEDYRQMAEAGAKAWKKHGALEYYECVQDDMNPKDVVFTFPVMAKSQPGELVIFSFIIYNSRQHQSDERKGSGDEQAGEQGQTDALRHEAHGLRRLQGHRRGVISIFLKKEAACGNT